MSTPEQKAAYINARTACMLAEMNGMIAENQQREHRQESVAYDFDSFVALEAKYGLDENSLAKQDEKVGMLADRCEQAEAGLGNCQLEMRERLAEKDKEMQLCIETLQNKLKAELAEKNKEIINLLHESQVIRD